MKSKKKKVKLNKNSKHPPGRFWLAYINQARQNTFAENQRKDIFNCENKSIVDVDSV